MDEVSFTVPDGQVGILLGPNGAGKSTIIKSIAGLLRYKGTILIDGIPARRLEAKRIFAYVPEIPNMFEALTVRNISNMSGWHTAAILRTKRSRRS